MRHLKNFLALFLVIASFSVVAKPLANKPDASGKANSVAKESVVLPGEASKTSLAAPKLNVVTTLSVLAALVREVGGDRVVVHSLSQASEDPHFVKAKPTFKRLVSDADLFFQIGRSLELWVPLVISGAGNSKLSGSGLVTASAGIKALEVPKTLTREAGDIHPEGNPHIWLSAQNGLKMAENIKNALIQKDPTHKAVYDANMGAFKVKLAESLVGKEVVSSFGGDIDFLWRLHEGNKLRSYLGTRKKAVGGWLKMAQAIDYPFISYHSVWTYFADEFGLKIFALIEEKSGVAPSLKYQNELVARAKAANVKHIVAESYFVGNGKLIDLIANQIGGQKIFVDVDCKEGESFIAMMDRVFKTFVDFKTLPSAPVSKL